jgi:cell division protein FtsZ
MVAGVGGAGGNALNHMIELGINDVTFLATNTDAQALERSLAQIKVQLGAGLGAGNDPEVASQAAKESIDDIIGVLRSEGTKMLFITAGMGGGTGTGASPIVAKAAQELGILTVAIVTTPFADEGPIRAAQAAKGIQELKQHTDSLLVLSNDSIEEQYGDLPYDEGFGKADDVLATAVKGIAEIITGHGKVNVDFADVNRVMKGSGRAFMGSGRAGGPNRAAEALHNSVNSLLISYNDIKGAKNILLNISHGKNTVTTSEASLIRKNLQNRTGGMANLIWGTAYKPQLNEDELELTIVATGFGGEADEPISVPPRRESDTDYELPYPLPKPVTPIVPPFPKTEPKPENRTSPSPVHGGTVQWKGTDRYADIGAMVDTPAWVRRKARLGDPYEARPSGKTSLEKEAPKERETGNLFE